MLRVNHCAPLGRDAQGQLLGVPGIQGVGGDVLKRGERRANEYIGKSGRLSVSSQGIGPGASWENFSAYLLQLRPEVSLEFWDRRG